MEVGADGGVEEEEADAAPGGEDGEEGLEALEDELDLGEAEDGGAREGTSVLLEVLEEEGEEVGLAGEGGDVAG